jgi:hypothetical protein
MKNKLVFRGQNRREKEKRGNQMEKRKLYTWFGPASFHRPEELAVKTLKFFLSNNQG